MPPVKTPRELIAGLTAEELDALRAELDANPASAIQRPKLSPRQRVLATALKERDHLDGCPVIEDGPGASALEAYEETAVAPSGPLQRLGVRPGGPVVVVRCMTCAGTRYFAGTGPVTAPAGSGQHVTALIHTLIKDAEEPGDLDQTL